MQIVVSLKLHWRPDVESSQRDMKNTQEAHHLQQNLECYYEQNKLGTA